MAQGLIVRLGPQPVKFNTPQPVTFTVAGGFNQYDENSSVSGSVETAIVTYTVPTGQTAQIQGFTVVAGVAARWKIKVDGTTKSSIKTSAAKPGEFVNFQDGTIQANESQVITLTIYHTDSSTVEAAGSVFGKFS